MAKPKKLDPKSVVEKELVRQILNLDQEMEIQYTVFYQAWPDNEPNSVALFPAIHFSLMTPHPTRERGWLFTTGDITLIGFTVKYAKGEIEKRLESLLSIYQDSVDPEPKV